MSEFLKIGLLSILLISVMGCSRQPENKGHDHSHSHEDGQSHSHGHSHDHGYDHAQTPHHGIVVPLHAGQDMVGFVELKLHDDKGDLELWLAKDAAGSEPFDLPLDSVITVSFPKLDGKTVELKARNSEKNEDEDGKGNIRDGKTNYFIFPGDTGADASFLVGKTFASDVVISFSSADVDYKSASFELRPHTH